MKGVHRLERAQRGVELRGVTVEGIEGRLHAFLLVALVGHRQVLDPW